MGTVVKTTQSKLYECKALKVTHMLILAWSSAGPSLER